MAGGPHSVHCPARVASAKYPARHRLTHDPSVINSAFAGGGAHVRHDASALRVHGTYSSPSAHCTRRLHGVHWLLLAIALNATPSSQSATHCAYSGASDRHAWYAMDSGPTHGWHATSVRAALQNRTICPETHVEATAAALYAKHVRHPPFHG
jgi:hypothetical protein